MFAGCIPRSPTRTARPTIDTAPWTERTVRSDVSGQSYSYLHLPGPNAGARPLLLIHGGIFDNRMWLYTHRLAERHEVFALEMPSESPFYQGRVEDFGDVVHDFVRTLELDELVVVSVSAGAWVAIDLVSRHPELDVRGLVIISSVMIAINEEEIEGRTELSARAMGFQPERLRSIMEYRVGRTTFDSAPGEIQQDDVFYVRPYSYYRQLFVSALAQGDQPQATERIPCPVLVLHGTDDETMPVEIAERTTTVFPDATFVAFEGFGHSMIFSHGLRVVTEIIRFIDERGLSSLGYSADEASARAASTKVVR